MKLQEREESSGEDGVLQMVNNVNRRFLLGRQEYLLLVKKQKDKDYCTLYLTDCESKFWIKKIDRSFLEALRVSLSIDNGLKVFSQHFANHLKENSRLIIEDDSAKLFVDMRIGGGLLMSCDFMVEGNVTSDQSPQDFRVVLKMFLRQLYEAKESQIEEQRKKWQKFQQNAAIQKEKGNPGFANEVLKGLKKDASELKPKKPKNRSLLNPNQKKRKNAGLKFEGDG